MEHTGAFLQSNKISMVFARFLLV